MAFGLVSHRSFDLLANTGPKTNMSWENMANVLIIGASRGIGLETASAALRAGHSVRALARSGAGIPIQDAKLTKVSGNALHRRGDTSPRCGLLTQVGLRRHKTLLGIHAHLGRRHEGRRREAAHHRDRSWRWR